MLADLIDLVGELAGRPVPVERLTPEAGDAHRNGGATVRARRQLDWMPRTSLREGLLAQLAWRRSRRASSR